MKTRAIAAFLTVALACMIPAAGFALTSYVQDFELLNQADTGALTADGWLVFGNVFDSGGGYLYGYGVFPAPNDGGGFCQIAIGEGGIDQGSQQLNVFSDYNNTDHAAGNLIEANVFQEQPISAADVGMTYVFEFDGKRGNLDGATTAIAFIKTLDPNAGYNMTNFLTVDMTGAPTSWDSYSIEIVIDAGLVGQLLQFGFSSTASNYDGSGVFYDNVGFSIDGTIPALDTTWGDAKALYR